MDRAKNWRGSKKLRHNGAISTANRAKAAMKIDGRGFAS
jgi:hypothetical protein